MNWENMEQEALNENIMKTLIKLSKADGQVADTELLYLLRVGLSMGMKEYTIKEMWLSAEEDLVIPTDEQGRMLILYYLISQQKRTSKWKSRKRIFYTPTPSPLHTAVPSSLSRLGC